MCLPLDAIDSSSSATISPKSFRRALRSDQSITASPLML